MKNSAAVPRAAISNFCRLIGRPASVVSLETKALDSDRRHEHYNNSARDTASLHATKARRGRQVRIGK